MNDLLQQLLQMGPGLGAGISGNGPGMQAFMEGYQRTMHMLQQQKRQKEQDAFAAEDRQRNIGRQETADANAAQDRAQRQALQGLQIPGHLAEIGSAADTPQDAQAIIESAMPNLMKVFGQETMAYGQPAVEQATRVITGRQKKEVQGWVDQALKTAFVADNPDADPELQLPPRIAQLLGKPSARLSELQTFAELPVGKPQGKTRVPAMAGSFEDFVQRKYGENPTADQILEGRKLYQQSDDRPRITVNTGQQGSRPPATQRRIDAVIKGFDTQAIVKRTQTMAEAVSFADSLDINTNNPSDDQALIYSFAKAMDPDSVVREGEYATVQKYAQSWADAFGFDVKRIFSNTPFLTPQARANMKATIRTKFNAAKGQYENLRNEYGRRIDRITGAPGGVDELTDYGAAFPREAGGGSRPQRGANPFRPQ